MKSGVNDLKSLDLEFIASKSHIPQSVVDDILNKRFDKINPVKAKGFIRILEREFDVDMSDWAKELETYSAQLKPEPTAIDKINDEAATNSKKPVSKAALIGVIVVSLAMLAFLIYPKEESASIASKKDAEPFQNEIKMQVSSVEINRSGEQNSSLSPKQNIAKQALEVNGTLYAEPSSRVWIGIKYLDTNTSSWFETTTAEKFEFNASRKQLIVFGHSLVKVVAGSFATAPKEGGKIRYYYDSGKLTEISEGEYNKLMGRKKPKKEANATVSQEQNGE